MAQVTPNEDDVIKIIVATDIHLGYAEKDPIRGEDSFLAFEEILQHAVANAVDMVLLGGDLFHDANPTSNTLQRCMKLLRAYCLGDKPIHMQFLSDQNVNFLESLQQTVNYEDPNLNVSIPVFSIHGNHDDPNGFGRLSSLDLLSTVGLINYFGKWTDLQNVELSPLMFRKGNTRLALYGLSYIHDNRLTRLFSEAKVVMNKPDDGNEWFNIMTVHQNRADRGLKNFLPESILPDFLDLVVWGHEHDCRIVPEKIPKKQFYVCQPGSSVATSLAEGESYDKHCGLLMIHRKVFKLEPIKLKTVRPFIFRSINLADHVDNLQLDEGDVQEKTIKFAEQQIDDMILEAASKLCGYENQPTLPLIRLRLECTDNDQSFNTVRFSQQYLEKVANPGEIMVFKRKTKRNKYDVKPLDMEILAEAYAQGDSIEGLMGCVEDVVDKYFKEVDPSKSLDVVFSKSLSEMCRRLVDYDDDNAASEILKYHSDMACKYLLDNGATMDNVEEVLYGFRDKHDEVFQGMLTHLDHRSNKVGGARTTISQLSLDDDDDVVEVMPTSRTTTATGARGRKTQNTAAPFAPAPTRGGRGRGGGRGSRGNKSSTVTTNGKQTTISRAIAANKKNESKTNRFLYNDSDTE